MTVAERDDLRKEFLEIIEGSKTRGEIKNALEEVGFYVTDKTADSLSDIDLSVEFPDHTVRIYRSIMRKEIVVQIWEPVEMQYSGVPVFEPSGRSSF